MKKLIHHPWVQKFSLNLILKGLGVIFSYAFTFYASDQYGLETWGVFSICLSVLSFFVLFGKMGIDTAFLKTASIHWVNNQLSTLKALYKRLSFILFVNTLFLGIILLLWAWFFMEGSTEEPALKEYFVLGALIIAPHVFYLFLAEGLRAIGRNNDYFLINHVLLYAIGLIILFILELFFAQNSLNIMIAYSLSTIAIFLFAFIRFEKFSKMKATEKGHRESLRPFMILALPMFLSNGMIVLIDWTDTLCLSFFVGKAEVGAYNVMIKLSNILNFSLLAVGSFIAPFLAQHQNNGKKNELKEAIIKGSKISTLSAAGLMLFLIGLVWLFEDRIPGIQIGLYSLILLAAGQFVNSFCGPTDQIMLMTGMEKQFQYIIMLSMCCNLILNLALIPFYGIIGAAFASMISRLLWNLLAYIQIRKKLGVSPLFFV